MGSDWTWSLHLPSGSLTPDLLSRLLAMATAAGFPPERPDGAINGFAADDGECCVLDRHGLVAGLADGTCHTNLWDASKIDVRLGTDPSSDVVDMILDSGNTWRLPTPEADPYRRLHRRLTDLWLAMAEEFGATVGLVQDEWSVEQVRHLPPRTLGWWTYLDAEHYERVPPLPPEADVRRTPRGAAVIALLDDPASVDVLAFERFHQGRHQGSGEVATRAP